MFLGDLRMVQILAPISAHSYLNGFVSFFLSPLFCPELVVNSLIHLVKPFAVGDLYFFSKDANVINLFDIECLFSFYWIWSNRKMTQFIE
jgi:hypothetical protein